MIISPCWRASGSEIDPLSPQSCIALLAALLFAAIVIIVALLERTRLPLHTGWDEPLIERTVSRWARETRLTPREIERMTFPIVMESDDRVCVELRGRPKSDHAGFLSCYDRQRRSVIVEIQRGPH